MGLTQVLVERIAAIDRSHSNDPIASPTLTLACQLDDAWLEFATRATPMRVELDKRGLARVVHGAVETSGVECDHEWLFVVEIDRRSARLSTSTSSTTTTTTTLLENSQNGYGHIEIENKHVVVEILEASI